MSKYMNGKVLESMEVEVNDQVKKKKRQRRKKEKKVNKEPVKFVTANLALLDDGTDEDQNVIITFVTKQQQFAIPRTPISVSADIDNTGLNILLRTLLQQGNFQGVPPEFSFLIDGYMLHTKLKKFLRTKVAVNRERGIAVEYLEMLPPPMPLDALNHDDWVSSISYNTAGLLLTGCYDRTLHIWKPNVNELKRKLTANADVNDNAHRLKIPNAHRAPIKAVSWIPKTSNRFVSTSVDQTVHLWEWNSSSNKVRCLYRCKGHNSSVECLSVSADGSLFVTGSWDGTLKLWTTDNEGVLASERNGDETAAKKLCEDKDAPLKKSPRVSLKEHTQSVTGLVWPTLSTLASCSWDHSVRLWDVDGECKLQQYVAPCGCNAVDSSPFNNTLLVATIDSHVRLLDSRNDAEMLSLVRVYKSHDRWVTSVKWSPAKEHHFATAGSDNIIKVWDIRSPTCPLYDLCGHTDQVLDLDWSHREVLFSGSADTKVKMFSVA